MVGEVLPIIPLSCLRAGGGRVSAHLGESRGWRWSSSRPLSQRPDAQFDSPLPVTFWGIHVKSEYE
ncbi:hypothetical protein Hanom_Chr05g00443511 [Helianthus anomalus]